MLMIKDTYEPMWFMLHHGVESDAFAIEVANYRSFLFSCSKKPSVMPSSSGGYEKLGF